MLWLAPLLAGVDIILAVSSGVDDASGFPWVSGLSGLLGVIWVGTVLYFRLKPCVLGRFITLVDVSLFSIVMLVLVGAWLIVLDKTPVRIEANLGIIIASYVLVGLLSLIYGVWYGKNRWESRSQVLRTDITGNAVPADRAQAYFNPPGGKGYNRSRMAYYSSQAALVGIIASHSSWGVYVLLSVAFVMISLIPANIASMIMRRVYLAKNGVPLNTRVLPVGVNRGRISSFF